MVLSLRKKSNNRVRQPLNKIMIPVLNSKFENQIRNVENLILSEVNVKSIEYITEDSGVLVKKIKPNFKSLGPRYGKLMKKIADAVGNFNQDDIKKLEHENAYLLNIDGQDITITPEDVEISTEDIPGWIVANQDNLTVALDISLTPELKNEGLARELVNRIQNIRKDLGMEVTDHISLTIENNSDTDEAFSSFKEYICSETLANLNFAEKITEDVFEQELINDIKVRLALRKIEN